MASEQMVDITDEFVTLGQLLKLSGVVMTGGEVKFFLDENEVLVNGEVDQRRGRKIRPGDKVETVGQTLTVNIVTKGQEDESNT